MDPIVISIVGALASGAVVAAKGLATDAVKDAYAALKRLVTDRYEKAGPFVEAVEAEPASADEQRVLAKQLAGREPTQELRDATTMLLAALEQITAANPAAAAVIEVKKLRALRNFEIDGATFFGTLIRADEATFEGDVALKGLHQAGRETDPKK